MYLSAGGRDWAEHQLREAGYDSDHFVAALVEGILDNVDYLYDASPDAAEKAVRIASKLMVGQPLTETEWTQEKLDEGYRWVPVFPRSIQMGDVVRVRQDAYSEPERAPHNGKQGKVSAIRNGIHVIYDDLAGKTAMGVLHQPDKLERRIKVAPREETNDA
jgi:hypothetical protein